MAAVGLTERSIVRHLMVKSIREAASKTAIHLREVDRRLDHFDHWQTFYLFFERRGGR